MPRISDFTVALTWGAPDGALVRILVERNTGGPDAIPYFEATQPEDVEQFIARAWDHTTKPEDPHNPGLPTDEAFIRAAIEWNDETIEEEDEAQDTRPILDRLADAQNALSAPGMAEVTGDVSDTIGDAHDAITTLRAALAAAAVYLGDDATDDSPEAKDTRGIIRTALEKTGGA